MTQAYTPEFGRGLAAWWMAHGPTTAGTEVRDSCFSFGFVHASLNPHADSELMFWKVFETISCMEEKTTTMVPSPKCRSIAGVDEGPCFQISSTVAS